MKILIAEDEPISRRVLQATLERTGYDVVVTQDGREAWQVLQQQDAPKLAILDWMMPGEPDGVEICRQARQNPSTESTYIILLTARGHLDDIVAGLDAGANDYLTKPFRGPELRARVQVGARVVQLQNNLADRILKLEHALAQIRTLEEIIPICSYCKKIRDDRNYWQQVDHYISAHAGTQFSHSICPDCYEEHIKPELDKLERRS